MRNTMPDNQSFLRRQWWQCRAVAYMRMLTLRHHCPSDTLHDNRRQAHTTLQNELVHCDSADSALPTLQPYRVSRVAL